MVATFMSIPQLFWLKKDSLPESTVLRQNALHTLAHLNTTSTNSTEDDMEALDCLEEIRFKKNASEIEVDEVLMQRKYFS